MLKTILFTLISLSLYAQTTFTYQSYQDDDDTKTYDYQLLKLALDKTNNQYGSYKLVPAPYMNAKRRLRVMELNKLENYIVKRSFATALLEKLNYVPIPVDRGLVGYKLFFLSPKVADEVSKVTSLADLKKYRVGSGIGWLDAKIMRANGFDVFEGTSYKGLFTMVAGNRIKLFPRGLGELFQEYEANKNVKNLMYNKNIALYYPLPRFFFSNKANKKAIERINKGLLKAYKDGSYYKLWDKYHQKSIEKADLKNRRIFTIENPFLEGIDKGYEKYIYQP